MLRRQTVAALLAVIVILALRPAGAEAACANLTPTRPGEVYLYRGLGNVFSRGMDEMGREFTRLGMESCVLHHATWSGLANDIIERSYQNAVSYPIIIAGHSQGAKVSTLMATYLGRRGIPVAFVALFDPVEPTWVGANVEEVLNFYIDRPWRDKHVKPAHGFTGTIENIDIAGRPNVNHYSIDKDKGLQQIVYDRAIALSDATVIELVIE